MTPLPTAHWIWSHMRTVVLAWALTTCIGASHGAVNYYVSPSGKDTWTGEVADSKLHLLGRRDGPFQTIHRALAAVRYLRTEAGYTGKATILLREGVYTLTSPLILSGEDAALSSGQLANQAYPDETVVLQGFSQNAAWIDCHNGLFRTPLPVTAAQSSLQVFWNGDAQPRARHPDRDGSHPYSGGFLYAADSPAGADRQTIAVRPGDLTAELWSDVESASINVWPADGGDLLRTRVVRADQTTRTLHLEDAAKGTLTKGSRYTLERSFAFLDAPGEWYHAPERQMLYFRPPDGRAPQRVTGIVTTPWVLALQGTPENPIRNVSIEGIDLRGASTALVVLQNAENCRITSCRFRMAGADGITLTGTGGRCRIAGCDLEDIPGIALQVASTYTETVIANNWVRNCGDNGQAAIRFAGSGVISGNLLHDLGGAAVEISGHTVTCERNAIHHTFSQTTGGGAIEVRSTDPLAQPTIIRQNSIRQTGGYRASNQGRWQYPAGVAGILLDCSARAEIRGNRIERASGDGLLLRRGQAVVSNNLFLFNAKAQIAVDEAGAGAATLQLTNCIFAYNGTDALWLASSQALQNTITDSRGNVIWPHAGTVRMEPSPATTTTDHWGAWQDAGLDLASVVADPCFVAPMDGDFRLRPNSFAFKLGFEPLPDEKVGLTVSNERKTQPVIMKPWREAYLPGPWGETRIRGTAPNHETVTEAGRALTVPYRRLPPVLDGICGEEEWPDGENSGVLIQYRDSTPSGHTIFPAAMRLAHDQDHLYVTVTVPVTALKSGMRWGQDDGVELSIRLPGSHDDLRVRGFPSGYTLTEQSGEADTGKAKQSTGLTDVPYAACILPGAWSCEWAIPIPRHDPPANLGNDLTIRVTAYRSGDAEHLVWPAPIGVTGSELQGATLRLLHPALEP